MKKFKKNKGFTLIETLLVIATALIIIVGVFNLYSPSNENLKVNKAVNDLSVLKAGVEDLVLADHNVTLSNDIVLMSKIAPDNMVNNTKLLSPWKGEIVISKHSGSVGDFDISYTGLPKSDCVKFMVQADKVFDTITSSSGKLSGNANVNQISDFCEELKEEDSFVLSTFTANGKGQNSSAVVASSSSVGAGSSNAGFYAANNSSAMSGGIPINGISETPKDQNATSDNNATGTPTAIDSKTSDDSIATAKEDANNDIAKNASVSNFNGGSGTSPAANGGNTVIASAGGSGSSGTGNSIAGGGSTSVADGANGNSSEQPTDKNNEIEKTGTTSDNATPSTYMLGSDNNNSGSSSGHNNNNSLFDNVSGLNIITSFNKNNGGFVIKDSENNYQISFNLSDTSEQNINFLGYMYNFVYENTLDISQYNSNQAEETTLNTYGNFANVTNGGLNTNHIHFGNIMETMNKYYVDNHYLPNVDVYKGFDNINTYLCGDLDFCNLKDDQGQYNNSLNDISSYTYDSMYNSIALNGASINDGRNNLAIGSNSHISNSGDNNMLIGDNNNIVDSGNNNVIKGSGSNMNKVGDNNLIHGTSDSMTNSSNDNSISGNNANINSSGNHNNVEGTNSNVVNSKDNNTAIGQGAQINGVGNNNKVQGDNSSISGGSNNNTVSGNSSSINGNGSDNSVSGNNSTINNNNGIKLDGDNLHQN